MFPSEFKSEEKLNMTINLLMVILVITSIALTIVESVESIMTPELKNLFLSIHIAILAAFLAELLYRLWSAAQKHEGMSRIRSVFSFLLHPLTIIDMIVIAPLFMMIWTQDLHNADTVILRVLRFTSILNMFHFYRSSRVLRLLRDMSKEIWFEMMVIFILSLQCILIAGVLFYAIENGTNPHVQNIFDGIWWSVITLTTIGYGDVYPITFGGRILGMILAMVGIGLVALPTGILTSGFIRALRSEKKISQLADSLEEEEKEQDELLERVEEIETAIKKTKKPSL
ncbi:ion transporter, partial [Candidatus Gracilibacteria bacterium]|nr:ion transporter [Candidatus Gracilibacteria bacterium]